VIDHLGFEVADLRRSAAFYDAVLYALGARRFHASDQAVAYGVTRPTIWLTARGAPAASYGHLALAAAGKAAVDAAHAAGVAAGGRDAGPPGPRPRYGPRYYAGYLLDPDGLRVEIVSSPR
jgi:catechol 2,3-dioxygenase-like lactoylglutathione lyase family enzyme